MENLKLAVYQNILGVSEKPSIGELIDKYESALCKYCFDKNANPILDINLLNLIVQSFEFYYMVMNGTELKVRDFEDLRHYQFDHALEIRMKSDEDLTKSDLIFMYSSLLIEAYGESKVNCNKEFFKQLLLISKKLKEYEWMQEKKKQLS